MTKAKKNDKDVDAGRKLEDRLYKSHLLRSFQMRPLPPPNPRIFTVEEVDGASAPGSRQGYWMDDCLIHGRTSFNTTVNGCEQCAAARLANEPEKT